jgi:hypothetical protein
MEKKKLKEKGEVIGRKNVSGNSGKISIIENKNLIYYVDRNFFVKISSHLMLFFYITHSHPPHKNALQSQWSGGKGDDSVCFR